MNFFAVSLAIMLASLLATAQAPPPVGDDAEAAPTEEGVTDELEQMPPAPVVKKRDTITLKSGVILTDVRIVSRSPRGYEVSVAEGVTMTVPRKQVANVEYGKEEELAPSPQTGPFPGDSLPADILTKLEAAMAEPPASAPADFVIVLEQLSATCGIPIAVAEQVKAWPEAERVWTVEVQPEMTLLTLLKDDFLAKFPTLSISSKDNGLFIDLKEARAPEKTPTLPAEPAAPATE